MGSEFVSTRWLTRYITQLQKLSVDFLFTDIPEEPRFGACREKLNGPSWRIFFDLLKRLTAVDSNLEVAFVDFAIPRTKSGFNSRIFFSKTSKSFLRLAKIKG